MSCKDDKHSERELLSGRSRMRNAGMLLAAAAVVLCPGCVKDDLSNTPHPDRGAVAVTADWSGRSSDAAVPETHLVRIGDGEHAVSGPDVAFVTLLAPGACDLLVYNRPDRIAVDGTTAAVERTAAGRVEPHPGHLFACSRTITVLRDDTLRVAAAMRQYVRRLDVELTAANGDFGRVTSARGTLEGVESAVDLVAGVRSGIPAAASTVFTRQGDRFTLFFRLLGVVPAEKQRLTVEIACDDGSTHTVVSDLSAQLAAFNDGVEPFGLKGDLLLPLDASVAGSIEGWEQTDAGNTDAH